MFILDFIVIVFALVVKYLTAIVGLLLVIFGLYALFSSKYRKIYILAVIPGLAMLFTYTSDFQQLKARVIPHEKTSFTIYLPTYKAPEYPFRGSNIDEFPVAPGNKYFVARYGRNSSNSDYLRVTEFNATTPSFSNHVPPKTYNCGPPFPSNLEYPPTDCTLVGRTPKGQAIYASNGSYYTFTINNTRITISGDTEGGADLDSDSLAFGTANTARLFKFVDSFKQE